MKKWKIPRFFRKRKAVPLHEIRQTVLELKENTTALKKQIAQMKNIESNHRKTGDYNAQLQSKLQIAKALTVILKSRAEIFRSIKDHEALWSKEGIQSAEQLKKGLTALEREIEQAEKNEEIIRKRMSWTIHTFKE